MLSSPTPAPGRRQSCPRAARLPARPGDLPGCGVVRDVFTGEAGGTVLPPNGGLVVEGGAGGAGGDEGQRGYPVRV